MDSSPNLNSHTKAALRKELQRAEDEFVRLPVVIAYLRERLGEPVPEAVKGNGSSAPGKRAPAGQLALGGRISSATAAVQVLRRAQEPMRTPELLVEVRKLGAQMKNSDNMYRTLVGNPRFKRVGRGLWALAEWPESGDHG
jgi:hypothetical protein